MLIRFSGARHEKTRDRFIGAGEKPALRLAWP
jgi:hypothetical protein